MAPKRLPTMQHCHNNQAHTQMQSMGMTLRLPPRVDICQPKLSSGQTWLQKLIAGVQMRHHMPRLMKQKMIGPEGEQPQGKHQGGSSLAELLMMRKSTRDMAQLLGKGEEVGPEAKVGVRAEAEAGSVIVQTLRLLQMQSGLNNLR